MQYVTELAGNLDYFCEYHSKLKALSMSPSRDAGSYRFVSARVSHPDYPLRKRHIQRAAEWADRLGVIRALRPVHDYRNPEITVLAYHRVMPTDALAEYPFDPELISATPRQFEAQMAYLRKYRNPVPLGALIDHVEGRQPLPLGSVAVTFDDGFLDTYRYAFPILKRHRIPATIFVATGYIDSGEAFWFELAAYLVYHLAPHSLELDVEQRRLPTGSSFRERTSSLRELQGILKNLQNKRRIALLTEWRSRFADQISRGATGFGGPLNWSQIREMADAGIDFGSHSVTHPNLTQLTDEELQWELRESKRTLEAHLQRPVCTVAYPIGNRDSFDDRVIAVTRNMGFQLGVTYVSGANPLADIQRYAIQRHGVGLETTNGFFHAMTNLPAWIR